MNNRRAGIWIRVSTDEQAQGDSPETHLRRAQMYCELHGWQPVAVYDLSGVSGKTVIEHPETLRMLADLVAGRINGLIFSRLARLARNTRELLDIADQFRAAGAALISISENLDTSTPAGQLMYTLFGALAEWERAEISARVAASVPIRAAQGKPTGGRGPWGYRWIDNGAGKRLVIDEPEAEKIKTIFSILVEEQGNVKKTCSRLNFMGLRTRHGAEFSATGLKRIIDDPVYSGRKRANYARSTGDGKHWKLKPEKEWVYHNVEPIIAPEQWDTIRELRMLRREGLSTMAPSKTSRYLFGGVLYCQCGAKMYTYHHKKDGGAVYLCRKCRRKVDESTVAEAMQEALEKVIIKPQDLVSLEEHADERPDDLRVRGIQLIAESEKLKRKKAILLEMCSQDPVVRDGVMADLRDLIERAAALEKEALRLGDEADRIMLVDQGYAPLLEKASSLSELWNDLEYDEQRQIVAEMFERIECRDGEYHFVAYWLPSLCKGSHTVRGSWRPPA
jgi:site-specific DNA recombinase